MVVFLDGNESNVITVYTMMALKASLLRQGWQSDHFPALYQVLSVFNWPCVFNMTGCAFIHAKRE